MHSYFVEATSYNIKGRIKSACPMDISRELNYEKNYPINNVKSKLNRIRLLDENYFLCTAPQTTRPYV